MKSKFGIKKAGPEYAHGYESDMTLKYHASRTAEKQAGWFLPYLHSGMTLLDCGCGSGSITVGLAKAVQPGQVTGVDIADVEIGRTRERAAENNITNIRFGTDDVCGLDFPENSFDAVFGHNVLEHICGYGKALQEMLRVLKPGGIIGIRDIDLGGFLSAPADELFDKAAVIWGAGIERTGGNPEIGRDLGKLLHAAGFVDVKMSASYETYSDLEGRGFFMNAHASRFAESDLVAWVTESGLATAEQLEATQKVFQTWIEIPGAFAALAHCEVVGRKPNQGDKS